MVTDGISMEPLYHTGDLVVIAPASSYHVGEIVAYHGDLDGHMVVLHRIVGGNGILRVPHEGRQQPLDRPSPPDDEPGGRTGGAAYPQSRARLEVARAPGTSRVGRPCRLVQPDRGTSSEAPSTSPSRARALMHASTPTSGPMGPGVSQIGREPTASAVPRGSWAGTTRPLLPPAASGPWVGNVSPLWRSSARPGAGPSDVWPRPALRGHDPASCYVAWPRSVQRRAAAPGVSSPA